MPQWYRVNGRSFAVSLQSFSTLLVAWLGELKSNLQFVESGPSLEVRAESECVGLESESNKIGTRVRLESDRRGSRNFGGEVQNQGSGDGSAQRGPGTEPR